eukprot:1792664-Alexandrium_andersonii.AAC.1
MVMTGPCSHYTAYQMQWQLSEKHTGIVSTVGSPGHECQTPCQPGMSTVASLACQWWCWPSRCSR